MTTTRIQLLPACWGPTTLRGLRQVKELILELRERHAALLTQVELEPTTTLGDAIQHACTDNQSNLVLAYGFTTPEIRDVLEQAGCAGEPRVISMPRSGTEGLHVPSASTFEERTVTRVRSMREGVRKAVLKIAANHLGELRLITKSNEFTRYFDLRYRVWKETGYLPGNSPLHKGGWEVDFYDRFSQPIGLFLPDGRLVACARLVRAYGNERTDLVNTIEALLNRRGDPAAIQAFAYRNRPEQPFDILWEFRGFRDYYAALVRARCSMAEVSRVAVDPDYRGRGLIEVLVDSLVSLARFEGIEDLLLACPAEIKNLYARCGFKQVPNLVSDRFFDIDRRSIVMERRLSGKRC